ncbi:hypothetical protein ACHQM5_030348 [Ranunculus cassubicifolius]
MAKRQIKWACLLTKSMPIGMHFKYPVTGTLLIWPACSLDGRDSIIFSNLNQDFIFDIRSSNCFMDAPLPSDHPSLLSENPSDQPQCKRSGYPHGGTNWRCPKKASPGNTYCEKHQALQDQKNEKRRKFPKESSRFFSDPIFPSGQRQCRRSRDERRCPEMALLEKLYCKKHQAQEDVHNEQKRKKRAQKRRLVANGSDEAKSSNEDDSKGIDELLQPSDERQCEMVRSQKARSVWRCSELASPGKKLCEKHHLQRETKNEKERERKRRRKEEKCLATNNKTSISTDEDLIQENNSGGECDDFFTELTIVN